MSKKKKKGYSQKISYIKDFIIIIGIPILTGIVFTLYNQQIDILKTRIEFLEDNQYDRAYSKIDALRKIMEEERIDSYIELYGLARDDTGDISRKEIIEAYQSDKESRLLIINEIKNSKKNLEEIVSLKNQNIDKLEVKIKELKILASNNSSIPSENIEDVSFTSLKGKLSLPLLKTNIKQPFGSKRNSKQNWKGVLFTTDKGDTVRSVAKGKVEFSGRLRGYGYLVIIRHDNNHRSLYGYNDSVLVEEGQIVNQGEAIALTGNPDNKENPYLYFEIRDGTKPLNPENWFKST